MLDVNYDKKSDVLYLGVADNSASYCADENGPFNIFKDLFSDEITGYMIFDFMEKYLSKNLPSITTPVNINFKNDVIPKI